MRSPKLGKITATLALLSASLFGQAKVVISQVYGGGGSSGTTAPLSIYTQDFIELFNAGNASQSLNGWTLKYSSATGTSWSNIVLPDVTLKAGQYFLVVTGTAGTTGSTLVGDSTGTVAMSATDGKVALFNANPSISTACPTNAALVDFVGFGAANCAETAATLATARNTAALRKNAGCTDTDNNSTDFSVTTPNPRTSAVTSPCGGAPATLLSINDVSVTEGNSGTVNATFTVSLNAPAPTGGVTFDIATADNTATTANSDYVANSLTAQTIPAGQQTYSFTVVVNGDASPEPNETFFVNVTNVTGATLSDGQGQGTINNDDFSLTSINIIQGSGTSSPLVGQIVSTTGIVTALRSNGFFLQNADADVDADPATSEAILVFTSAAPPAAAAVGNRVTVIGTVSEFTSTGNPAIFTTTEITAPSVLLTSTGNPLPTPITLTTANLTLTGGITQLERFEGMLLSIPSLTVVAPTDGNVSEANATATSTGVFYGVLPGTATPFREPGIETYIAQPPCAAGSGCAIPVFDTNPERIRVDSDAIPGQSALNVSAGAVITNLLGVLDHNGSAYTLYPTQAPTVGGTPVTTAPIPVAPAGALTVAAMNVERLFDATNDPNISDPILTSSAYTNRLGKISLAIRDTLRTPDVIALEEVENLTVLQDLATRINNDAVAASQPNPSYLAFLIEGNDVGGIDVGFLVRTTQFSITDVTQLEKNTTYISPCTNNPEILNDRPPLRLRGTATKGGQNLDFTIFVNHLRSLNGISDTTPCALSNDGNRVRTKRAAQANNLAQLVQDELTALPNSRILLVGDFNAFEVNDGFVDTINTLIGSPAPLTQVTNATNDPTYPNLTSVSSFLQGAQRYSYNFDGNHQIIDHALLNPAALQQLVGGGYARLNADFPESFRGTFSRPERYSDHDPVYAFLTTATPATAQFGITRAGITYNRTALTATTRVTVRNNTANSLAGPLSLLITGLPDGVTVTNATLSTPASAAFNITAPLAPGQSVTVIVNFALKAIVPINYNTSVFSGTL